MGSYQFDIELRHISDAKGSKPYNRKREVFCLSGHLDFLDKTDDFHEGARFYFYPKTSESVPVLSGNREEFQPEYIERVHFVSLLDLLLSVPARTVMVLILAFISVDTLQQ